MKYYLEIYEKGSRSDVLKTFESNNPFLSINKGDLLNTAFLNPDEVPTRIEVEEIEHIFWGKEDTPSHKICVYTK